MKSRLLEQIPSFPATIFQPLLLDCSHHVSSSEISLVFVDSRLAHLQPVDLKLASSAPGAAAGLQLQVSVPIYFAFERMVCSCQLLVGFGVLSTILLQMITCCTYPGEGVTYFWDLLQLIFVLFSFQASFCLIRIFLFLFIPLLPFTFVGWHIRNHIHCNCSHF